MVIKRISYIYIIDIANTMMYIIWYIMLYIEYIVILYSLITPEFLYHLFNAVKPE